jgi:UDP-N-acetylmuramate--alanine ligase
VKLENIHRIYFIGIGGIGMSALARYFNANGRKIYGYDRSPSSLTDELMAEGMEIHFEDNVALLPAQVDLVVYTPAIPDSHSELNFFRQHHYPVIKRSDLLELLTKNSFTIAVAGTHGKTTTSSMIAHILKYSGYDCTAFLGGITANYETNFLIGRNNTVVVEADEYDRSFLKLHPDVAVVTSCDPDHLDVYGEEEEVVKAYGDFANLIKPGGRLITKKSLPFLSYTSFFQPLYYSLSGGTDFFAARLQLENGTYRFDLHTTGEFIPGIHLGVAGYHNVENAVAAGAVAFELNIAPALIRDALQSFRGVRRRFEFILRNEKIVLIDDYAHHPQELTALLKSVREIFPSKKITCIFQPHLYSRTRDFAAAFGQALSLADEVLLLPIYPAREQPIEGVSAQILLKHISVTDKKVVEKLLLQHEIMQRKREVVITAGAGDIDQWVQPVSEWLQAQAQTKKNKE